MGSGRITPKWVYKNGAKCDMGFGRMTKIYRAVVRHFVEALYRQNVTYVTHLNRRRLFLKRVKNSLPYPPIKVSIYLDHFNAILMFVSRDLVGHLMFVNEGRSSRAVVWSPDGPKAAKFWAVPTEGGPAGFTVLEFGVWLRVQGSGQKRFLVRTKKMKSRKMRKKKKKIKIKKKTKKKKKKKKRRKQENEEKEETEGTEPNTICSTWANFDFGQINFGQLAEVEYPLVNVLYSALEIFFSSSCKFTSSLCS